jgi:undecaprenyl-diphosphatase
MTYVDAAILGLIQGLTEFLPVSSSGHLRLAQHLLETSKGSPVALDVAFDVALHVASAIVILAFLAREILAVLARNRIVLLYGLIATIPAGVLGALFKDPLEKLFDNPMVTAFGLLFTGAVLLLGDRLSVERRDMSQVGLLRSIGIGVAQAVAIVPGISRSGMTITAGLVSGLKRPEAFTFSFLLALPVILGAGFVKAPDMEKALAEVSPGPFACGFICSLAFSAVGLVLLRRVLVSRYFKWFGFYCLLVGVGAIVAFRA